MKRVLLVHTGIGLPIFLPVSGVNKNAAVPALVAVDSFPHLGH